ncbi:hypothetical protein K402DRAFT_167476 [Aulographum hederae CBS 113979]|uniref:Lytic polysaccharide monooxygenase n=1 Tax=Aulographum hederae CBS 113979 TaxID=1176131 RepID=A0A6G1GRV2_9PEZI|nr:hypothetical protein K402DRAFT_167476 [Aulographum hederae CBS 113979]
MPSRRPSSSRPSTLSQLFLILCGLSTSTPLPHAEANPNIPPLLLSPSHIISRQTPTIGLYICANAPWTAPCSHVFVPETVCISKETEPSGQQWFDQIGSFGPDEGGYCVLYAAEGCHSTAGTRRQVHYPGIGDMSAAGLGKDDGVSIMSYHCFKEQVEPVTPETVSAPTVANATTQAPAVGSTMGENSTATKTQTQEKIQEKVEEIKKKISSGSARAAFKIPLPILESKIRKLVLGAAAGDPPLPMRGENWSA